MDDNSEALFPVIEAVLFAAGYPVPYEKLAKLTETEESLVREAVSALAEHYRAERFGIQIVEFSEECQICTKEAYEGYVREALGIRQGGRLSNSSLEVLAIVAYHQPVTRSQIEHIRGVDSSYAVSSLVVKKLIEEKGRLEVPGRPVLFGTTADFLRCFGFSSLDELPDASAFLDNIQTSFDELEEEDGAGAADRTGEVDRSDADLPGEAGAVGMEGEADAGDTVAPADAVPAESLAE